MKLIFIRHGDPNYADDCLTEKGRREAAALAKRVKTWDITHIYCSPLGRAKETAQFCLDELNRHDETTYEWLKEFYDPIIHPHLGKKRAPWDFMPSYWTAEPKFYDKNHWFEAPVLKEAEFDIKAYYDEVCNGLDGILAEYGYVRKDGYYEVTRHPEKEETLVFFCHLGVSYVCMSHLLGISPSVMWQSFFTAPTSVTVLGSEERIEGEAGFRCQVLGCTKHLSDAGEPISSSGYFTDAFQL